MRQARGTAISFSQISGKCTSGLGPWIFSISHLITSHYRSHRRVVAKDRRIYHGEVHLLYMTETLSIEITR
ncbi:hypothetical protein CALVIDRAFT_55793 [Calocera viscosa TUFC12733]|uniref:Uncharacterized protein n=1 Tax=Calocera viscosa (strain TUFC12733) TaxID=1330018 RepID=A0A167NW37_CALVF|nr:hypothetical protein CALVIDRAFT_55793 [Calocera viscosa TUFC12733]